MGRRFRYLKCTFSVPVWIYGGQAIAYLYTEWWGGLGQEGEEGPKPLEGINAKKDMLYIVGIPTLLEIRDCKYDTTPSFISNYFVPLNVGITIVQKTT